MWKRIDPNELEFIREVSLEEVDFESILEQVERDWNFPIREGQNSFWCTRGEGGRGHGGDRKQWVIYRGGEIEGPDVGYHSHWGDSPLWQNNKSTVQQTRLEIWAQQAWLKTDLDSGKKNRGMKMCSWETIHKKRKDQIPQWKIPRVASGIPFQQKHKISTVLHFPELLQSLGSSNPIPPFGGQKNWSHRDSLM